MFTVCLLDSGSGPIRTLSDTRQTYETAIWNRGGDEEMPPTSHVALIGSNAHNRLGNNI